MAVVCLLGLGKECFAVSLLGPIWHPVLLLVHLVMWVLDDLETLLMGRMSRYSMLQDKGGLVGLARDLAFNEDISTHVSLWIAVHHNRLKNYLRTFLSGTRFAESPIRCDPGTRSVALPHVAHAL